MITFFINYLFHLRYNTFQSKCESFAIRKIIVEKIIIICYNLRVTEWIFNPLILLVVMEIKKVKAIIEKLLIKEKYSLYDLKKKGNLDMLF